MKIKNLLICCFVLCLCLCAGSLPVFASEIETGGACGNEGDNVTWTLDSDGVLTISGQGDMEDYENSSSALHSTIPWRNMKVSRVVIDEGVTSVGREAFMFCACSSVEIPESVTKVGTSAFAGCSNLESIRLPDSIVAIGNGAFSGCRRLTSVTVPKEVRSIGLRTFAFCRSLTSVSLPDALTSIGEYAFLECESLTTVRIPASVTSVQAYAFSDCTNLTDIILPQNLTTLGGENGRGSVFLGCKNLTSVAVPIGMKYIAPSCFEDCTKLRTVFCFGGSDAQWDAIEIEAGNAPLEKAFRIYTYSMPEVTLPSAETYAQMGKTAEITADFSGLGRLTCTWYEKDAGEETFAVSDAIGITYSTVMTAAAKDREVYLQLTDRWGNTARSETAVLRMAATITEQPEDCLVKAGDRTAVSVTAVGDGLTYAWYAAVPGSEAFTKSSTITGSVYAVEMNENRDGRRVYCVVTDRYGNTDRSETVTLNMHRPPVITVQPKTTYTKSGAVARAFVQAEGEGLTFRWYIKNAGKTSYHLSSVTGPAYSCTMNAASKDRLVYCVVTDAMGETVRSQTVRLRMAATVTGQPGNAGAAAGEIVKTSVAAVGDGLTYQWYIKNPGKTSFSKSSVTTASYACRMSETNSGRQVYCVVKDRYGKTDVSETATLGLAVRVTGQPKTAYAKLGKTAVLFVSARGDGLTYRWYVSDEGDGTKFFLSSKITSFYALKMTEANSNRRAYCVITDKYGCSVRTNTVRLRLAATVTEQPQSVIAESGAVAKTALKAVGDGLTYQWYIRNPGQTVFSKSSVTAPSYTCRMSAANDGREAYCVVTDRYGKTEKTNIAKLCME